MVLIICCLNTIQNSHSSLTANSLSISAFKSYNMISLIFLHFNSAFIYLLSKLIYPENNATSLTYFMKILSVYLFRILHKKMFIQFFSKLFSIFKLFSSTKISGMVKLLHVALSSNEQFTKVFNN